MTIWFFMLGVLGASHITDYLYVFKAFNPYYAINLLTRYPHGFWLLGAVFLCTTGAEALYSDLGHCGKRQYQSFMGICKKLPNHKLSGPGSMVTFAITKNMSFPRK